MKKYITTENHPTFRTGINYKALSSALRRSKSGIYKHYKLDEKTYKSLPIVLRV